MLSTWSRFSDKVNRVVELIFVWRIEEWYEIARMGKTEWRRLKKGWLINWVISGCLGAKRKGGGNSAVQH